MSFECLGDSFIVIAVYLPGMWSRSQRLGLETVSRPTQGLVSVSSRPTWPTSRSRLGLEVERLGLGSRLLGSRAQAIISATTKQQQYCGKQNVCILHNIKKILNNIGMENGNKQNKFCECD